MHPSPSHARRIADDLEAARQAGEMHMAGIVIKNHYEPTAGRAFITNKYSNSETTAYGSIALNYPEGGLNPYAVDSALNLGARYVWLPTHDSAQSMRFPRMSWEFFDKPCGLTVLDEQGKLKKEVYEIFEIVKFYHAALATGHLSPEESVAVCTAALKEQVKIILTHPDWNKTKVPLEVQKDLADKGVIIEKLWFNVVGNYISLEDMLASIRTLGSEHVYIATDMALSGFTRAVDGYCDFIYQLIKAGFTDKEIHQMSVDNPVHLLGI